MYNLVLTLSDFEQLNIFNQYKNVAHILVGNNNWTIRTPKSFDLEEIEDIVANSSHQIYVPITKLIHNFEILELEKYLFSLEKIGVNGVIFSDFSVLELVKAHNLSLKLIYNTETTITNYYFSQMTKELGIEGIELAKEITLEEAVKINEQKVNMVGYCIHGHVYMYQSVRRLIDNYQKNYEIEDFNLKTEDLFLFDDERNSYYPVIENQQGTHILSANDICLINNLHKVVTSNFDYYKIDGFGYKPQEYVEVVELYQEALEMLKADSEKYIQERKTYLENIKKAVPHKHYSSAFAFKKTVY